MTDEPDGIRRSWRLDAPRPPSEEEWDCRGATRVLDPDGDARISVRATSTRDRPPSYDLRRVVEKSSRPATMTRMTHWVETVPAFVVLTVVLFLPGWLVVRALGSRGLEALAVSPAVSVGLIAAAATVAQRLGIGWGLSTLAGRDAWPPSPSRGGWGASSAASPSAGRGPTCRPCRRPAGCSAAPDLTSSARSPSACSSPSSRSCRRSDAPTSSSTAPTPSTTSTGSPSSSTPATSRSPTRPSTPTASTPGSPRACCPGSPTCCPAPTWRPSCSPRSCGRSGASPSCGTRSAPHDS